MYVCRTVLLDSYLDMIALYISATSTLLHFFTTLHDIKQQTPHHLTLAGKKKKEKKKGKAFRKTGRTETIGCNVYYFWLMISVKLHL